MGEACDVIENHRFSGMLGIFDSDMAIGEMPDKLMLQSNGLRKVVS
jgi:hypothetical protein